MVQKKMNLVPLRSLDPDLRSRYTKQIRRYYNLHGPLAFVRIKLLDNRSEFLSPIEINVRQDNGDYLIEATQAVARANAIAYLSELIHPVAIFIRLTLQNQMRQAFRYLLLGEGETGLMVYSILQHYWEAKPPDTERPHLFLMSA